MGNLSSVCPLYRLTQSCNYCMHLLLEVVLCVWGEGRGGEGRQGEEWDREGRVSSGSEKDTPNTSYPHPHPHSHPHTQTYPLSAVCSPQPHEGGRPSALLECWGCPEELRRSFNYTQYNPPFPGPAPSPPRCCNK